MRRKHNYEENARELEMLSAYYPVDREKKLVTVDVSVDSGEDLLGEPAAPGFRGPLKAELFEKCRETISKFPAPYRLNVRISVGQWGALSERDILRAVRDYVEISENTKRLQGRRILFLSAIFVIVGFQILSCMFCAQNLGWFGESSSADLWVEAVDTAGTVFLWEAITVVFLEASEQSAADPGIRKKIACLTFHNPDGTVLEVSNRQLFHHTDRSTQLKRILRDSLLVSSCGFVVTGFTGLIYMPQSEYWGAGALANWGIAILGVLAALQIFAGVGGFFMFWGRRNGFVTFAKVYAYCSLVIIALAMLVTLATGSFWEMLWMAVSFLLKLVFIFSLLLDAKISAAPEKEEQLEL